MKILIILLLIPLSVLARDSTYLGKDIENLNPLDWFEAAYNDDNSIALEIGRFRYPIVTKTKRVVRKVSAYISPQSNLSVLCDLAGFSGSSSFKNQMEIIHLPLVSDLKCDVSGRYHCNMKLLSSTRYVIVKEDVALKWVSCQNNNVVKFIAPKDNRNYLDVETAINEKGKKFKIFIKPYFGRFRIKDYFSIDSDRDSLCKWFYPNSEFVDEGFRSGFKLSGPKVKMGENFEVTLPEKHNKKNRFRYIKKLKCRCNLDESYRVVEISDSKSYSSANRDCPVRQKEEI